jgi:hypothetical protein
VKLKPVHEWVRDLVGDTCQTCIHRRKFNRRSGCVKKGVEKTINCMDIACENYIFVGGDEA